MSKEKPMAQILIVDDYALLRKALSQLLSEEGFGVHEASDGIEALESLKTNHVDLIILDQDMPEMNGVETFKAIKALGFNIPVIFLTGYGQTDLATQARLLGAADFLTKPPDRDVLLEAIKRALSM